MEDEVLKVHAGLFNRQFFRSTCRVGAIRGGGEISRRRAKMSATIAEITRAKEMKILSLPFFSTRQHVTASHLWLTKRFCRGRHHLGERC